MRTKDEKRVYDTQYAKENIKRVPFNVQKDYYDNVLKPYCDAKGYKVNALIKKALTEYMKRYPADEFD